MRLKVEPWMGGARAWGPVCWTLAEYVSLRQMKSIKHKPVDRCEYCGEPLKAARVRVYRRRGVQYVLFENVPALVCRSCGHRLLEAAAVEAIEHALARPAARRRTVRLTVISA
jgi:YgiT-type zinc finger domain-containing protein